MFFSRVRKVYLDEASGGVHQDDGHLDGSYVDGAEHSPKHPPKLLHNIKGLILDFDGTLFDNALIAFFLIAAYPPDALRIWRERLVRKRFAGCDYASAEEYHQAFFTALGKASLRSPQKMRSWYFNHYMPRMVRVLQRHYQPRQGVQKLFLRFSGRNETGRAGNVPRIAVYSDYPFLEERLEALGVIHGPGVLLYGPESFGAQKPAARPFLRIAADLGARPEEVLVIGDRIDTDGHGAFNAGMRFFCLETGRRGYYRLDPYRRRPEEKPHGPSLVMYAGVWDDLVKALLEYEE
jgi:FMN phosphatase YigB (HAD superfamily)